MAKRRFIAPERKTVAREVFEHPAFASYGDALDLLRMEDWPSLDLLNSRGNHLRHAQTGRVMRFVAQTDGLLDDGMHYETRIHSRGEIPTRLENWHDLLNAMIWLRWSAMKSALNQRQADDVARIGPRERTRAQCALTHFDKAGVAVRLCDDAALAHWDAHDWPMLGQRLHAEPEAMRVIVFGHAVLEHALDPSRLLVGKAMLIRAQSDATDAAWMAGIADAIACGGVLNGPLELRPLPLAVLPGWHAQCSEEAFLRSAPCFQPLRDGRHYPLPMSFSPPVSVR